MASVLPAAKTLDFYFVDVEGGHSVLAHLAGRMRRNRIRVVLGDQVTVAVSPTYTSWLLIPRTLVSALLFGLTILNL